MDDEPRHCRVLWRPDICGTVYSDSKISKTVEWTVLVDLKHTVPQIGFHGY